MLSFLLLLVSSLGRGSASFPDMACLIINLEHMDCTWARGDSSEFNYTFMSRLGSRDSYNDCPRYLQEDGYNIGCRLPYRRNDKFSVLHTRLSHDNGLGWEKDIDLRAQVKLNPPVNLSVEINVPGFELWLYWNISSPYKCVDNEVRFRKNSGKWQTVTISNSPSQYTMSQVSLKAKYEIQVRTRVTDMCYESKFWSDWSTPVFWGNKTDAVTGLEVQRGVAWYPVMAVGGMVLLLATCYLLIHLERVVFVPIVPNPSKNLEDLFKTFNGNVEEWLHISKEFKQGFQANYSETACPVREYPAPPGAPGRGSIQLGQPECPATTFSQPATATAPPEVPPGLV